MNADITARVSQAGAYLRGMSDVIAECYQVLTDGERWENPMSADHAAISATQLVISAMEMASWGEQ